MRQSNSTTQTNEAYHDGMSCSWIELEIKVRFKRGNDIYLKLNRFKIFERVEEDIYLKRCLAVANCSNHSKVSNIWCIFRLPREDKAGTSLVDVKSRNGGPTDSLLVGSIEHNDA